MPIDSVMPSNYLILCHPLLLLFSIFPNIGVFSNESTLHIRWPKYWSFSFRISPSNEYSGLISYRIDWFDLHAVQENLKSLLQHHNLTALILRHSTFFMVHLTSWWSSGEGNGNPLQYSCLENPMPEGAWWATVHEVAKNWTWLGTFTSTFSLLYGPFLTSIHGYWKNQISLQFRSPRRLMKLGRWATVRQWRARVNPHKAQSSGLI